MESTQQAHYEDGIGDHKHNSTSLKILNKKVDIQWIFSR